MSFRNLEEISVAYEEYRDEFDCKILRELIPCMQLITQALKNKENRTGARKVIDIVSTMCRCFPRTLILLEFPVAVIDIILRNLGKSLELLEQNVEPKAGVIGVVTECFRILRNLCAGCSRNQDLLNKRVFVVDQTVQYINRVSPLPADISKTCLRCGIQFLGNLSAGHANNQDLVWDRLLPVARKLLSAGDTTLGNYTCMALHTCLCGEEKVIELVTTERGHKVMKAVVTLLSHNNSEFGLYIVEKCLQHKDFMDHVYPLLDASQRCLLLDIMVSVIEGQRERDIHENNLTVVSHEFTAASHTVLGLEQNPHDDLPLVYNKLLEVLCFASGKERHSTLKDNPELLNSAISVLRCIHLLGKSHSHYAPQDRLRSQNPAPVNEAVFGLKRNLVRLVGNLSYQHKRNQDMVRKLEGIPLVLDLTKIDGVNPYITQWSVFALRNLCEDNSENQRQVAALELSGVDDRAGALRDLGVSAEVKDGKVILKSDRKT